MHRLVARRTQYVATRACMARITGIVRFYTSSCLIPQLTHRYSKHSLPQPHLQLRSRSSSGKDSSVDAGIARRCKQTSGSGSRRRCKDVMKRKIADVFRLREADSLRDEVGFLLQKHANDLSASDLVSIIRWLVEHPSGLMLDDYLAALLARSFEDTAHLSGHQLLSAMGVLRRVEQHSPGVASLLTVLLRHLRSVDQSDPALDWFHLAHAIAKFKRLPPSVEASQLLEQLCLVATQCQGPATGIDVGMVLLGLNQVQSLSPGVAKLLGVLTAMLGDENIVMTARGVSSALYCFRNLREESVVVSMLLGSLAACIERSDFIFPELEFGQCCYSLRGLGDSAQVHRLLGVVCSKLPVDSPLSDRAVSMALFGVQRMSSDSAEVRGLLTRLAAACTLEDADDQFLCMVAKGLFQMDAAVPEVRALLTLLATLIEQRSRSCGNPLDPSTVTSILYCMTFHSSHVSEVDRIFRLMGSAMRHTPDSYWTPSSVNTTLGGLRSSSTESAGVALLLDCLLPKIADVATAMDVEQVGRALFSLRNCALPSSWHGVLSTWVSTLLDHLTAHTRTSGVTGLQCFQYLLFTFHIETHAVYSSVVAADLVFAWVKIKVLLQDNISAYHTALASKPFASKSERNYALRIASALRGVASVEDVRFNCFLFGFEADVVVTVRSSVDKILVNFEVDGMHHNDVTKLAFCAMRDAYLREVHGVFVERIDAMSEEVAQMSQSAFRRKVLDSVLGREQSYDSWTPSVRDALFPL